MIKLFRVNNIALISSAELEFGPGLNLLTGETGAGKSILIDALGLLLGDRASTDLIRTGQDQGAVEGLLESDAAVPVLEAHGLPVDGREVVIRREVQSSGKSRATVNGALTPVAVLRELGEVLVAVHGQHEPQGLLNPDTHLDLLDRHAGLGADAEALAEPYRRVRELEAALQDLRSGAREAARRREMVEFQANEIERAGLAAGEEEALRRDKVVQANAGRLASLADDAYAALHEDEAAVVSRLGQVYRRIDELAAIDPAFAPHAEARSSVLAQLQDLALFLRDYREKLQVSPARLDEIESRLALLDRLKRKYGATIEEVMAFGARCRQELEHDASPEERGKALETERAAAAARYLECAQTLSRKRRSAAPAFEKKVESELALLAMERTRFRVRFDPEAAPTADGADSSGWTARGLERAEFLLSPNTGEELRPLARIASGGELSRILLALKSVASLDAPGKTLVFDEVDAGIGGRVADVVGRKLRAMASRHQVLCVTHLPQIASLAEAHYAVRKQVERGRTVVDVRPLSADERVEEVARMLGGESVTETARRHAREMVKQGLRP
jgi:DNA repair protein RecN (Recombination protein N)